MAGQQAATVAMPTRVPLGWDIETRDSTMLKDAVLVNCYQDTDPKTGVVSIYRRPGWSLYVQSGLPPATVGGAVGGQGIYQNTAAQLFFTFGGKTYERSNPSTPLITWPDPQEFITHNFVLGGKPGTILNGLFNTYFIDLNLAVTGPFHTLDADYPVQTTPGVAYLDGTTYVGHNELTPTNGNTTIHGSNINSVDTATSWDPLNFISAQMMPDGIIYVTKQLGYIMVIKFTNVEFFYDVGNATGSPLAPAENLFFPIGCASATTIQKIMETLIWVTLGRGLGYRVVMVDNTRPVIISTPAIERILNNSDIAGGIEEHHSFNLNTNGHTFYGLTLVSQDITLVYDLGEKVWYWWRDHAGNYLPWCSTTGGAEHHNVLQHTFDGNLYLMDGKYNADYIQEAALGFTPDPGVSIPIEIRTPRWDGGTARKKNLTMMTFVGDIIPGQIVTVQTSDDDYQTWSTPKNIDLGMDYPNLANCGTFRRRAWKLTCDNYEPFRMQFMELQTDIGTL